MIGVPSLQHFRCDTVSFVLFRTIQRMPSDPSALFRRPCSDRTPCVTKPRNPVAIQTGKVVSTALGPFLDSLLHCQFEFIGAFHQISGGLNKLLSNKPCRALPQSGLVFFQIFVMMEHAINLRLARNFHLSFRLPNRLCQAPKLR